MATLYGGLPVIDKGGGPEKTAGGFFSPLLQQKSLQHLNALLFSHLELK